MNDFTKLAAVAQVIDRARGCISREDLPGLVMSDPGSGGYVAAYARVLNGGVAALLEVHDGVPLFKTFDITENLLLSHNDASRSVCHRWFSILTAGIEILAWNGFSGLRDRPLSQTLGNLIADAFALQAAEERRAPLDLLPLVFKELQQACTDRHQYVLALLGELVVASLDEADVEAKCRELNRCHDEFQQMSAEDGEPNPWYVPRPEFIWGAVLKSGFGHSHRRPKELRMWLELVEAHFPSSPAISRATAERLLREGREWPRSPRRG